MCLVPPPRFERGMFTTQGHSFTDCLLHPLAYDGSKHIPIVIGWKGGTRTPNAFRRQHQKLLTCQLVYLPITPPASPCPLTADTDPSIYRLCPFLYFHLAHHVEMLLFNVPCGLAVFPAAALCRLLRKFCLLRFRLRARQEGWDWIRTSIGCAALGASFRAEEPCRLPSWFRASLLLGATEPGFHALPVCRCGTHPSCLLVNVLPLFSSCRQHPLPYVACMESVIFLPCPSSLAFVVLA